MSKVYVPKRWAFVVVWLICALLGAIAPAAAAQSAGIYAEPLLEPVGNRASIKLSAFSADAHITCAVEVCTLEMVQTYWVQNGASDAYTLEIGLPADNANWIAEQAALALDGSLLAADDTNDTWSRLWRVPLAKGQHAALTLRYQHSFGSSLVLATAVELESLVRKWGLPEGASVRFTLADTVGDDAIFWMVPFISRFDGRQIAWDYETPNELISHQVVMLRPDTWHQLQESIASQDNGRLAALYLEIDQALAVYQIPRRNYFGQAVAAYHAAIASEPQNTSFYVALADAYHDRAAMMPEESLNYEQLAAQMLEQAHNIAPEDTRISERLAETYLAIALASAAHGGQVAALQYLERLRTGALPRIESDDRLQTLALRWSVELAEQGDEEIAFQEAQQLLPPAALQLLDDYAPPLSGLETTVTTNLERRQVSYRLRLYPGTAAETILQINDLAERLSVIPALDINQAEQAEFYTLTLTLRYNTLSELQDRTNEIKAVISQENSILMHLLLVPWNHAPEALFQGSGSLRRKVEYREQFDSTSAQLAWREQSQYAQWRLAESSGTSQGNELEQLETRLTTYLLRQQQQVWRQLPAGSSWVYRLDMEPNSEPTEWICSFGENRLLLLETIIYNEPLLTVLGIVSIGLVTLALFALLMPWSSLRQPRH